MKITFLFFLSIIGAMAGAATIPNELLDLAGGAGRTKAYKGLDSDKLQCKVEASDGTLGYSIYLTVVDAANKVVVNKLSKLQIGLGHNLDSLKKSKSGFVAVVIHPAESQVETDSRYTLEVELRKDGSPASFKMKEESLGFFGWNENSKGDCIL